mmetsp:Transcript_9872/g.11798  ORF Transcript_9872/g.11798 Transcript_9872/m.11798 type:complete len:218 (-) Transcript_9872:394-1047(-)
MVWEEGRQLLSNTNWAHSWSSTSVRNGEGFVEVQVANIGPDASGGTQTHLCIHISAIHINLAAVFVDKFTNFLDVAFEHPVSGWISDHERRKVITVLLNLGREIIKVYIPQVITLDSNNTHARHNSGGGVGPVCGDGDDTHVPMSLTIILVIGCDDLKPKVFALRACVWLQRHRVESRDVRKIVDHLLHHLHISLHLLDRCERVELANGRPGHRDHL